MGNRTRLIYPGGQAVTYTYDAAGRLVRVDDADSGTAFYSYTLAGRLEGVRLPNGVEIAYEYDGAGRLVEIGQAGSAGALLARYEYHLDEVGNRIALTETVATPAGGGDVAALLEPDGALARATVPPARMVPRDDGRGPGMASLAHPALAGRPEWGPVWTGRAGSWQGALTATAEYSPTSPYPPDAPFIAPGASVGPPVLEEASPEWWAAVQEDIRRSEYQVTWQDRTYLADLAGAYQAPNRAHNLRAYFTPEGIRVVQRTWATSTLETGSPAGDPVLEERGAFTPTWTWGNEMGGLWPGGPDRSRAG